MQLHVSAAQRPFAILLRTGTVASGETLSLDASTSFASNGRSLVSFQWSVQNLTGSSPVVTAPAQAVTTMQITGTSQFTLRLTVTDDQGGQDVEEVVLATPAPPPAPPPGGGGGGGGQFSWGLLGALLAGLWMKFLSSRFFSTSGCNNSLRTVYSGSALERV